MSGDVEGEDHESAMIDAIASELIDWEGQGVHCRVSCSPTTLLCSRILDRSSAPLNGFPIDGAPRSLLLSECSAAMMSEPPRMAHSIPDATASKFAFDRWRVGKGSLPDFIVKRCRNVFVPKPTSNGTHIVYYVHSEPRLQENVALWGALWYSRVLSLPVIAIAITSPSSSSGDIRSMMKAFAPQSQRVSLIALRDQLHQWSIPLLIFSPKKGLSPFFHAWIQQRHPHLIVTDEFPSAVSRTTFQNVFRNGFPCPCAVIAISSAIVHISSATSALFSSTPSTLDVFTASILPHIDPNISQIMDEMSPACPPSIDLQAPLFVAATAFTQVYLPPIITRQFGSPDSTSLSLDPSYPRCSHSHKALLSALPSLSRDIELEQRGDPPSPAFLALHRHIQARTISQHRLLRVISHSAPTCFNYIVHLCISSLYDEFLCRFPPVTPLPAAPPREIHASCSKYDIQGARTGNIVLDCLQRQLKSEHCLTPKQRLTWINHLAAHVPHDVVVDQALTILNDYSCYVSRVSLLTALLSDLNVPHFARQ